MELVAAVRARSCWGPATNRGQSRRVRRSFVADASVSECLECTEVQSTVDIPGGYLCADDFVVGFHRPPLQEPTVFAGHLLVVSRRHARSSAPPPHRWPPQGRHHPGSARTPTRQTEGRECHPARAHTGPRRRNRRTHHLQGPRAVTAGRAAPRGPPTPTEPGLALRRRKAPCRLVGVAAAAGSRGSSWPWRRTACAVDSTSTWTPRVDSASSVLGSGRICRCAPPTSSLSGNSSSTSLRLSSMSR
jgi:hypothetical protein